MWDAFLGSESIALSLTALFLANAGWLLMGWRTYKITALIVLSVLMVFTPDTYAYFFLTSALVILSVFWFSSYQMKVAGVSFAFLIIFVISSQLAVLGLRPYRAVLMNTSLRIMTAGQKFDVNKAFMFDGEQAGFRKWRWSRTAASM